MCKVPQHWVREIDSCKLFRLHCVLCARNLVKYFGVRVWHRDVSCLRRARNYGCCVLHHVSCIHFTLEDFTHDDRRMGQALKAECLKLEVCPCACRVISYFFVCLPCYIVFLRVLAVLCRISSCACRFISYFSLCLRVISYLFMFMS